MPSIITGCAGFIGSFLTERLVEYEEDKLLCIDNLSAGRLENIAHPLALGKLLFLREDLRFPKDWREKLPKKLHVVYHFAANPEVRHSYIEPLSHYRQNLDTTMHVLEESRKRDAELVVFASSSTVYGDPTKIPTPEDHPLRPVSVYGATKAAGEILCSTYARLYDIKCLVLRYANIIGPRLRHGVIYDFILKLRENKRTLEILGDGSQKKSYLYIEDAIEASLRAVDYAFHSSQKVNVFNVGNRDWVSVMEIADTVVKAMGLENVEYRFKPATKDGRGWPGDVKTMLLDIEKISRKTEWTPQRTSRKAVEETAIALVNELIG